MDVRTHGGISEVTQWRLCVLRRRFQVDVCWPTSCRLRAKLWVQSVADCEPSCEPTVGSVSNTHLPITPPPPLPGCYIGALGGLAAHMGISQEVQHRADRAERASHPKEVRVRVVLRANPKTQEIENKSGNQGRIFSRGSRH